MKKNQEIKYFDMHVSKGTIIAYMSSKNVNMKRFKNYSRQELINYLCVEISHTYRSKNNRRVEVHQYQPIL